MSKTSGWVRVGAITVASVCSLLAETAWSQTLIIDNTGNPFLNVPLSVTASTTDANKFTTDNQAYELTSIKVNLAVPSDTSSPLTVQLLSDNSSAPGTVLDTLSGSNPTGGGIATFTSSGSVHLDANTAYWVALSTSGTANYSWDTSTFVAGPNTANTGVGSIGGFSQNGSAESTSRWFLFGVSGTAVPEPATYATVSGMALLAFGVWRRRAVR
jgi:hypothetical protein